MGAPAPVDRSIELDDVNLSDPEFWTWPRDEREGAFAVLRDERPVAFFEEMDFPGLPKGPGYWALSRYEDVRRVNRDACEAELAERKGAWRYEPPESDGGAGTATAAKASSTAASSASASEPATQSSAG